MEIFSTYHQGQKALVVKDALGLIKNPVVLQGQILDFIGLIDGMRTPRDIQLELIRQRNGVFVSVEDIQSLLSKLDSLFLLDSDHYRDTINTIFTEYSQQPVRAAVLAGQVYPGSIEDLNKYLDSFFPEAPGVSVDKSDKKVSALIAPHIDLSVGKKVYSQAYTAGRSRSAQRHRPPQRTLHRVSADLSPAPFWF